MVVSAAMRHAVYDGIDGFGAEVSGEALTVALDVVQAWAVVLTLGFTIVLFFFLAFCVCSRKEDSYGDYDDFEGIRTVRMSQHLHDGGENGMMTDQTSQASSRCTMKRELPAIPGSGSDAARTEGTQPPSQQGNSTGPCRPIGGVQVLPSTAAPLSSKGSVGRTAHSPPPSDLGPSSSSTISSDLATRHTSHSSFGPAKEHQYAHLKPTKEEHPYAKVGGEPETDTDNYDEPRVVTGDMRLQSEVMQKSHYESVASPLPAAPCDSAALYPPSLTSQQRSPSLEIQASSAIAGHTPANEELPYMTPKITQASSSTPSSAPPSRSPLPPAVGLSQLGEGFAAVTPSPSSEMPPQQDASPSQQQHFSGDSQDSRGYTSISVREPLSALRSASQPSGLPPHMQQHQEGYYMTVSDDSADETYACIYERGTASATSSAQPQQTYAQIQPPAKAPTSPTSASPPAPSSPTVGGHTSPSPLPDPSCSDPPAPPSVDSLKHVLHSRQASSGSTSGVISSPSVEKRGGSIGGASRSSPLPPLPQGDQHYYEATPPPPPPSATSPPHSAYFAGNESPHKSPVMSQYPPIGEKPSQQALEDMYAKVMKKRGSTGGGHSRGNSSEATDSIRKEITLDSPPGGHRNKNIMSAAPTWSIVGVVGGPPAPSAPAPSDPGYETVQNYPPYETVKNGRGEVDSEPGYETVTEGKRCQEEESSEPGYETVKGGSRDSEPGYETVSAARHEEMSEPGYESVRQDQSEPGYEQVQSGRPVSECDSNYEQLKFSSQQPDPGYESVKSCYDGDSNYERVSDYNTSQQAESSPMYAEINKPSKSMPVYASVQKRPPEEQALPPPPEDTAQDQEEEKDFMKEEDDDDVSDERDDMGGAETDDEGLDDVPARKYKRSLEEEAAILVSEVEETAINILSARATNGTAVKDGPEIVAMVTKEEARAAQEDLLTSGLTVTCSSEGSDTSSDAVFSRKVPYEQPSHLPGLVSFSAENGTSDAVDEMVSSDGPPQNGEYTPEGGVLLKKDSGSVETEDGTKDTNKASIEVQNGSAHSSVDNSSSGREDISPEDEVCLPPHEGGLYDPSSQSAVAETEDEEDPEPPVVTTLLVESNGEEVPMTPTVLSIPVPQTFFADSTEGDTVGPPPLSPPHACLIDTEDELPEQDQQVLPPPPPILPEPLIPLESSQESAPEGEDVPPPPDLLNDAPECDLPPPLPLSDLPPPLDDAIVPPPPVDSIDPILPPPLAPPPPEEVPSDGMTVTVNPMAEIDELASRVATACQESPVAPPPPAPAFEDEGEEKTKV